MPIMTGWKRYQRIVTRIAPGNLLACVLLLLCAGAADAEDYPSKPISIIVGPGPDILARIVGQKLTEAWGQPVIVEPRPAAGGIVAADAVAKALPNGYTMLLSTGSYTVNSVLRPKSPYDFQRDF